MKYTIDLTIGGIAEFLDDFRESDMFSHTGINITPKINNMRLRFNVMLECDKKHDKALKNTLNQLRVQGVDCFQFKPVEENISGELKKVTITVETDGGKVSKDVDIETMFCACVMRALKKGKDPIEAIIFLANEGTYKRNPESIEWKNFIG